MMRFVTGRSMFALLLVAVAVMLQAPDAYAIADDISTAGFGCSGGVAYGKLFVSGAGCPTMLTMDNVFSFLVCNFEQLSANIMGYMYCGMILNLAPSVMAALALATVLYGIMFTFGMIPATGQEALKFTLKCAFIFAFATEADYLIGIAYRGALAAISSGSSIVISLMSANGVTSGADVYAQLDGFLGTLLHDATDYLGGSTPANMCKNAIFAVIGTMFVVFPMLAYLGIMLVGRIVMTFFRAVFAYIYAIVGITFVLLLAPFFLIFALFKLTSNLFERWLGYLVSFALQVVLLFSFLAFIFSLHLEKQPVVTNLTRVIMYNSEQAEGTSFRLPFAYCTLCDFKVMDSKNPTVEMKDTNPNYIADGMLVCTDHQSDSPVPKDMQLYTDPNTGVVTGRVPVKPTFAISPDSKDQLGSLLKFAGNGILSLIVLALCIEHLLKLIPSLAQKLASSMNANYASQLGGGWTSSGSLPAVGMPGESLIRDFNAGFNRGFERNLDKNGITASAQGLKDGMYSLVTGRTSSMGANGQRHPYNNSTDPQLQQGEGLSGAFSRYITDPSKFGQ